MFVVGLSVATEYDRLGAVSAHITMAYGQCRMGCHILLVPVLETGSQILRKKVHWNGGHSRRRPGRIYIRSSERRGQMGSGIVFRYRERLPTTKAQHLQ